MRFILLLFTMLTSTFASASSPQYSAADSVKVMTLLRDGDRQPAGTNLMLYYARRLKGVPYVAKTLDRNSRERLVVNLRELDCTTYVETVLALTMCTRSAGTGQGHYSFGSYCDFLRRIRYQDGIVSYASRLHYFTGWISDNTRLGFVSEIQEPNPPFTRVQTVKVDYMSRHPQYYPMLSQNPSLVRNISDMEKSLTGLRRRYIPKSDIANTSLMRKTIHDGDIIAIVTNKSGLDTSHIGIAVWHKDGLHMLNASQIHHKVVEEPMLLRTYMQKHPSQVGIRIVRVTSGL